jgi:hypothetical protein
MPLTTYWICTHIISQYLRQITIHICGAVVIWLALQSGDREFDPYTCRNFLLYTLFTKMAERERLRDVTWAKSQCKMTIHEQLWRLHSPVYKQSLLKQIWRLGHGATFGRRNMYLSNGSIALTYRNEICKYTFKTKSFILNLSFFIQYYCTCTVF